MSVHYGIEDSPQLSIIVDTKTQRITDANYAAVSFWGYPDKEAFLKLSLTQLMKIEEPNTSFFKKPSTAQADLFLPDGFIMKSVLHTKPLQEDPALLWMNISPLEDLAIRDFCSTTSMYSSMQRQLLEEKNISFLFESAPIGLVLADEKSNIRKVNRHFCNMFDHTYAPSNSERLGELIGCADLTESAACGTAEACMDCSLRNGIIQTLQSGQAIYNMEIEKEVIKQNIPQKKWLKVNIAPVRMEDGHYAILAIDDITSRITMRNKLEILSTTDDLSGIPNRRGAIDFFRLCLNEMISQSSVLSLAMIDLDEFKSINDMFSHGFGDEVIRACSELISGRVRAMDFVARYGGDEFIVVFPNTNAAQAKSIMERVKMDLNESRIGGRNLNLTFSAGILEIDATNARTYSSDALIHSADLLLYKAKAANKNIIIADTLHE